MVTITLKNIAKGMIAILLISFVWGGFAIVRTGTVGVKHTFGKANMVELQPGLYFKIPFAQSIVLMDVKANTINYNQEKAKDEDGIKNKQQIKVMDKRSLSVDIDLSIIYKLKTTEAAEVLYRYGLNYDEKVINPIIRDEVRSAFGQYAAEDIASKRSEIGSTIKSEIILAFEGTPFEIEAVQLRDIQLPPEIYTRMLEVQKKNQEVELAKQELEKIEVEAQSIVLKAKAEADMKIESARGEAESKKAVADAEAHAIRVVKTAEAEGFKKLSNSISNGVIQLEQLKVAAEFAESWSGGVPSIVTEGTNTIIPAEMKNLGVNISN